VPFEDMYRTFNMGIGLILVCSAADERHVLAELKAAGESNPVRVGSVVAGECKVAYRHAT